MKNEKPVERLAATPAEVAIALGVGRTTVYAMLRRGDIPSYRQGKKLIRVPLDELKAYQARLLAEAGQ